jgi:hypothetical protein
VPPCGHSVHTYIPSGLRFILAQAQSDLAALKRHSIIGFGQILCQILKIIFIRPFSCSVDVKTLWAPVQKGVLLYRWKQAVVIHPFSSSQSLPALQPLLVASQAVHLRSPLGSTSAEPAEPRIRRLSPLCPTPASRKFNGRHFPVALATCLSTNGHLLCGSSDLVSHRTTIVTDYQRMAIYCVVLVTPAHPRSHFMRPYATNGPIRRSSARIRLTTTRRTSINFLYAILYLAFYSRTANYALSISTSLYTFHSICVTPIQCQHMGA